MNRALLFILLACLPASVRAETGGFTGHLQDAIRSNHARLTGYARQSSGRSRKISRALLATEWASLPVAWYLDRQAEPFRREGIPVLQQDFVDMALTPKFSDTLGPPLPTSVKYEPLPWREWKREILRLNEQKNFSELHARIAGWLEGLAREPRLHVMVRHVLESTARVAYLAPQYERLAWEKKLTVSPMALSQRSIYLHAQSLSVSDQLDAWAMPLQREGIAILQNDVPPIHITPKVGEKDPL